MPEDTKKQHKSKNEPKEPRKRRGRQPASTSEQKLEKELNNPKKSDAEVSGKLQKQAYEPPPPEFYKNLKRETEDISKITDEANSKYKKKEILSNWSKYEMPIESYDEIDEQENLGADYETLASAPLSVGSHFQFKHEKSWDTSTRPTAHDKYFEINMLNLNTALSTIPFFERNSIDVSLFSEMDIQNMNHRATKFKQKYYKDKKFTTPELEAQEKILNSLTKSDDNNEQSINKESKINLDSNKCSDQGSVLGKNINASDNIDSNIIVKSQLSEYKTEMASPKDIIKSNQEVDNSETDIEKSVEVNKEKTNEACVSKSPIDKDNKCEDDIFNNQCSVTSERKVSSEELVTQLNQIDLAPKNEPFEAALEPAATNPVIESPEDLEKWLDDFLEG